MANTWRNFIFFSLCLVSLPLWAERPAEMYGSDANTQAEIQPPPPMETTPVIPDIPEPPPISETAPEESTMPTGDVINTGENSAPEMIILDFPRRGMDMSKVKNELGEPLTKHPAVGNPPITRWDYADRTVFFEYNHVIHTVAK